ncbi:unnamed protein product [Bursaphelenchus xylophilus]|uniref:(pine wood nematode) hypothetical protein n=1 Tax=Bursaphelenchus xylophilus TaxID=6326 RepID=A0A1I7SLL3_BURXY|nr:unnamed protein product [Bursaphelenchus xylophilus]CAG9129661.1 unnamed protein product [Bursaphelenchus xylophilus]
MNSSATLSLDLNDNWSLIRRLESPHINPPSKTSGSLSEREEKKQLKVPAVKLADFEDCPRNDALREKIRINEEINAEVMWRVMLEKWDKAEEFKIGKVEEKKDRLFSSRELDVPAFEPIRTLFSVEECKTGKFVIPRKETLFHAALDVGRNIVLHNDLEGTEIDRTLVTNDVYSSLEFCVPERRLKFIRIRENRKEKVEIILRDKQEFDKTTRLLNNLFNTRGYGIANKRRKK